MSGPAGPPVLCAVAGDPVLHSRSPGLLGAAFAACGLDGRCVRLAASSAREALETARSAGMAGLNVTAPFKETMASLVDELDPAARAAGAVNAVVLKGGKSVGCNTDLFGVAEALRASGAELRGSRVCVLGTGGAARAAAAALGARGAHVFVAGRNAGQAKALAAQLGGEAVSLEPEEVTRIIGSCHALVSCLSTARRVLPPEALHPGLTVLDAYYAAESELARDARAAGCRVVDGREWLLFQGAESFRLFTGLDAPQEAMRRGLGESSAPRAKPNLALVGFMGAGKDATAHCLQEATGRPVFDADREIERTAGKNIPEIFSTAGEDGFRALETEVLGRLQGLSGLIVNAGGGAVLRPENRRVLSERCTTVWLWASPETTLARVPGDGSRPLLAGEDRVSKARALLGERIPLYAEVADLMVPTDRTSRENVAERILHEVRRAFGRLG